MNARMRPLLWALGLAVTALGHTASAEEDVRFEVAGDQRRVATGDEVEFKITLRNDGDTAASEIQIRAKFSAGMEPIETRGTEENAGVGKDNTVTFPPIASLNAGESLSLGIRVRAKRAGVATCRISVTDASLGGLTLEKDEAIRVR